MPAVAAACSASEKPGDGGDVALKQWLARFQPGEIPIRQRPRELWPVQGFASLGNEIRADAVADAARARVQHGPDLFALIEADFDEVVTTAKRAQMG